MEIIHAIRAFDSFFADVIGHSVDVSGSRWREVKNEQPESHE
jgi:hypothetical protein